MRNFDVRILGDVDDGCRVEVTASPAGETSDAVVIPALLQDAALDAALRDLRDFRVELGTVRELGTALWRVPAASG